ncbi:MAG: hypothetical protein SV201_11715 [Pseudomonadota bacterium]|nr:hypothetical protein [Pseudomonadota bacterium]
MAFVVKKKREVWYPIEVPQLRDDGSGEVDSIKVEIKYEVLTRDEFNEYMRELAAKKGGLLQGLGEQYEKETLEERDRFVMQRVKDWGKQMVDEEGEPIPFTHDNLRAVMRASLSFAKALEEGLFNASRDAPVKNS